MGLWEPRADRVSVRPLIGGKLPPVKSFRGSRLLLGVTRVNVQRIALAASVMLTFGWSALAQTTPPDQTTNPPSPPQAQQPLTCADFVYRGNGAWSPAHTIALNGVTMGDGVTFAEGVSFGGMDLAHDLNLQCAH